MGKVWQKALVPLGTPALEAMKLIGESRSHICMVVDDERQLLGTVTDGDVRRAILNSVSLDNPIESIMRQSPTAGRRTDTIDVLLSMMQANDVREIPIVDEAGRVIDLVSIESLTNAPAERNNWVVLVAGGLGTRLRPFTDDTPKPMLEIGDQPMLLTIIQHLRTFNFSRFYISINYKAEQIMDFFGDGSHWGAEIRYLRENTALGTAGALGLIEERPDEPLLVTNGDILNQVNFAGLMQFHREEGAVMTMCVCDVDFRVPYGVVAIEDGLVQSIAEKPVKRFRVNAGIYVVAPCVLDHIHKRNALHMPDLVGTLIEDGQSVAGFPVTEYWADIGRPEDLARAKQAYAENFS